MASNRFGEMFTMTTWGESHGKAIGVVIDGCPAGLTFDEQIVNYELARRAPGKSSHTSPRKEPDKGEILSGVFEGVTTGAPISIVIWNKDAESGKYEPIKNLLRPGHANYCYLEKYGVFDYRGGGRASARETACRVAAGAVAKQLLAYEEITVTAFLRQVHDVAVESVFDDVDALKKASDESTLFCPDPKVEQQMVAAIAVAKEQGDSLGGVVEFQIHDAPAGLGDPIYQKLEARLAAAMMSIPATKGIEIGRGFESVTATGSENNDLFVKKEGEVRTVTNDAGGILGGMSSGMPIVGRVAFKPTSSIMKAQSTVDIEGNSAQFQLPEGSRHDPCVALRAAPVVEAMAALVIADTLLMNRSARR